MIFSREARADGSDDIKSCFQLELPNRMPVPPSLPSPPNLWISSKIAQGLRASGFTVKEPGVGSSDEIEVFSVILENFSVWVVVSPGTSTEFRIRTYCRRPYWNRVSSSAVSTGWIRVCQAIESVLTDDLKTSSLIRLSRREVKTVWPQPSLSSRAEVPKYETRD
jgi:hypothetical protein